MTKVLHVGAHKGEENDVYLEEGVPQNSIFWIEAIPELCTELAKRLPNVIQAVVSDSVGQVEFKITNHLGSSSILELKTHLIEHPHVQIIKRVQTNTILLDTISDQRDIQADFLNLDIQGAELKCLRGFERGLSNVKAIYTEVNERELYANCVLLPELDAWLDQRGFIRVKTEMTQWGWGDALYIRKEPRVYIVDQGAHHKNREAIRKMMAKNNVKYTECSDLSQIDDAYTLAICENKFFPPDAFPANCKVLYGPQFFVFPNDKSHPLHRYTYDPKRFFYNTLSEWNKVLHKAFAPNLTLTFVTCPFGIDIENIKEVSENRNKVMVYFKGRHPSTLDAVTKFLSDRNVDYYLIKYGSYQDADFKQKLADSKFVIWIGSHESQGFAFQETLASNVPILLWDVKSMYDEYNNGWVYEEFKHSGLDLEATTANVWSDECGVRFYHLADLPQSFDEINSKTFTPRKVIEKLSLTATYENILSHLNIS